MSTEDFDLKGWLEEIRMVEYADAFADHAINYQTLISLNESDFREIGVSKVGHLKRFLAETANLKNRIPEEKLNSLRLKVEKFRQLSSKYAEHDDTNQKLLDKFEKVLSLGAVHGLPETVSEFEDQLDKLISELSEGGKLIDEQRERIRAVNKKAVLYCFLVAIFGLIVGLNLFDSFLAAVVVVATGWMFVIRWWFKS